MLLEDEIAGQMAEEQDRVEGPVMPMEELSDTISLGLNPAEQDLFEGPVTPDENEEAASLASLVKKGRSQARDVSEFAPDVMPDDEADKTYQVLASGYTIDELKEHWKKSGKDPDELEKTYMRNRTRKALEAGVPAEEIANKYVSQEKIPKAPYRSAEKALEQQGYVPKQKRATVIDSREPTAIVASPGIRGLLDTIGNVESGGNYNAYSGNGNNQSIRLTDMTLNEVLQWQDGYKSRGSETTAVGKYQILKKTLQGAMDRLGLTGNEIFTPELQDKLALQLMKGRGLDLYLSGKITKDRFMDALASEWAALPLSSGKSAYEGVGFNTARMDRESLSALVDSLSGLDPKQVDSLIRDIGREAAVSRMAPESRYTPIEMRDKNVAETINNEVAAGRKLGGLGFEQDLDPTQPISSQANVAALERVLDTSARIRNQFGGLVSDQMRIDALRQAEALNMSLSSELARRGFKSRVIPNPEPINGMSSFGSPTILQIQDEDGNWVEATPGFIESMLASKFEIGGAIAGAATGARLGTVGGPWTALGGAIVGGAIGAMTGTGTDILLSAAETKYDLDAINVYNQVMDAGLTDVVFGTVIGGGANIALRAGKAINTGLIKGTAKAWDLLVKGNEKGAYEALKEIANLSEAQIDEIITKWKGNRAISGSRENQAIQAFVETQAGGEELARAAISAGESKTLGSRLAANINERAQSVKEAISKITDENAGTVVVDELNKYTDTVRKSYEAIKQIGVSQAPQDFRFNYMDLAIDPLLESMERKITNPATLEHFKRIMERVQLLGGKDAARIVGPKPPGMSDDAYQAYLEDVNPLRTFENLIELRKLVNGVRKNKKFAEYANAEAGSKVMANIDRAIEDAARQMPKGSEWLQEWRKINTEYSKMKAMESNTLYKSLTRPGVNYNQIVPQLVKHIQDVDGTYMEVMGKLPPAARRNVEGAILDNMFNKASVRVGDTTDIGATGFPELAESLKQIEFTTPDARHLKRVVNEMADVFKNDKHLHASTGSVQTPKFQSYLTTDPVVRLKYEIASNVFNGIKSRIGTDKAKHIALVRKVGKLMDNPQNAKLADEVSQGLGADPVLATKIKQLAIEYAKWGEKETYPKVPIYRVAKPGRQYKTEMQRLGQGRHFFTDEKLAQAAAKANGAKVYKEDVLPRRIATPEDIKRLLGREPTMLDYRNKDTVDALRMKGFTGLAEGDKVMLFKN